MRKNIILILIILWMGVIFNFSCYNKNESSKQSNEFIYNTICKIIEIFDKNITEESKKMIVNKLNYPIRKLAHVTEYFILCILVLCYINYYNINIKYKLLLSFIICFIYAGSDEIHQIFSQRGSTFKDVIIDSTGSLLWIIIYYIKNRKKMSLK